jgi:alkane 1-monooxygenase
MGVYWLANIVPLSTAIGLWLGGPWSWLAVAMAYGLVPALDWAAGTSTRAPEGAALQRARDSHLASVPLYLAFPVQLALLWGFAAAWQGEAGAVTRSGWILSMALTLGGYGIVIAHELVHRRSRFESWLGRLLLMMVLYMHFAIEHVRGHHATVGTDADPASARAGQTVYGFVLRSVLGQFASAWRLETGRLARRGRPPLSAANELLWMVAIQAGWLTAMGWAFGARALAAYMVVAVLAFCLLEVVNYIEHYGLRRGTDARGRLEPVRAQHSWNSDHRASRVLLFELPRHADHHMSANRPYQTLQSVPGAPQLPAGYPAMVLLALLPPLWFRVMDKRLAALPAIACADDKGLGRNVSDSARNCRGQD